MLADSAPAAGEVATITQADLAPLVDAAIARLGPMTPALEASLRQTTLRVTDLAGLQLGDSADGTIWIDADAAGNGWFVDRTPGDDSEFVRQGDVLLAVSRDAVGRMDLLSVLAHEFGHLAGLGHADGLMAETLVAGTRVVEAASPMRGIDTTPPAAPAASAGTAAELPSAWDAGAAQPIVIDWKGGVFASQDERPAAAPASAPATSEDWRIDFANHLGKSATERDPNARIKIAVPPLTTRLVSEAARRISALFG
jgi:hypothetical protein